MLRLCAGRRLADGSWGLGWDQLDVRALHEGDEVDRHARSALDEAGHQRVKIVCSGGFDTEKIREFEAAGATVDSYGVGSSLLRGQTDFTADVVCLEGAEGAKAARRYRPNPRLDPVP